MKLHDGLAGDFVNANFVDSALKRGDRKMIAAQGPLEETVEAFWRMVLQEGVKLIVSVCKLQEGGRSKCHKYWPEGTGDKVFEKVMSGAIQVKKVGEKKIGQTLVERTFEVKSTSKTLNVT